MFYPFRLSVPTHRHGGRRPTHRHGPARRGHPSSMAFGSGSVRCHTWPVTGSSEGAELCRPQTRTVNFLLCIYALHRRSFKPKLFKPKVITEVTHARCGDRRWPGGPVFRHPAEAGPARTRRSPSSSATARTTRFGFGVVFSDQTLDSFAGADVAELSRDHWTTFAYWDDIEIHVRGTVHRVGGNGFCGCSRRSLLMLLHDRARALGVELLFNQEATLGGFPRRRSDRRRRRHQQRHPRARSRRISSRSTDLRPEPLRLDGQHPTVRRLHLLLQGTTGRASSSPIATNTKPAPAPGCWKPNPKPSRRAGLDPCDRGGVRALHGERLRRGTGRPQADHQSQPVAAASR